MEDSRLWKEIISKLRDPFPGRLILLTATSERTQPEAFYLGPEFQPGAEVCWHCVVRKEAADNLLQPITLLGNRPMHLPSQLSFDLLEFRNHAITRFGLTTLAYECCRRAVGVDTLRLGVRQHDLELLRDR
jgi:hypothetical protein